MGMIRPSSMWMKMATPSPSAEQKALQVELASRVLARRRLLPFIQRFDNKYLAGWVHKDICRRLEKFSADVAKGLSPRLMLLMPPRHGKSRIASQSLPALTNSIILTPDSTQFVDQLMNSGS